MMENTRGNDSINTEGSQFIRQKQKKPSHGRKKWVIVESLFSSETTIIGEFFSR